jgi:hypothetical protein
MPYFQFSIRSSRFAKTRSSRATFTNQAEAVHPAVHRTHHLVDHAAGHHAAGRHVAAGHIRLVLDILGHRNAAGLLAVHNHLVRDLDHIDLRQMKEDTAVLVDHIPKAEDHLVARTHLERAVGRTDAVVGMNSLIQVGSYAGHIGHLAVVVRIAVVEVLGHMVAGRGLAGRDLVGHIALEEVENYMEAADVTVGLEVETDRSFDVLADRIDLVLEIHSWECHVDCAVVAAVGHHADLRVDIGHLVRRRYMCRSGLWNCIRSSDSEIVRDARHLERLREVHQVHHHQSYAVGFDPGIARVVCCLHPKDQKQANRQDPLRLPGYVRQMNCHAIAFLHPEVLKRADRQGLRSHLRVQTVAYRRR